MIFEDNSIVYFLKSTGNEWKMLENNRIRTNVNLILICSSM